MDLTSFRKARGLSLERAAEELGLGSRGYLHDLENGRATWTLRVALRVEDWSDGQVSAEELVDGEERELLVAHRRRLTEDAQASA